MPNPTFFNLPAEKQQTILNYAIEEFASHDYDSASISQVVARSGIAKGSLYQYFSDKRDLYHYLLELAAAKKGELLAQSVPPANMSLFERLHWLFQEMARFQLLYPQLAQLGYRAVNGASPFPEDITAGASGATRQYFAALIEEGKQRGEIRPEVDAEVAAFVFTAALTELTPFLTQKLEIDKETLASKAENLLPLNKVEEVFTQIVAILRSGIATTD